MQVINYVILKIMQEFCDYDVKVFDLSLGAAKLEESPNFEQSAARLTGLDLESGHARAVQIRGSRKGICEELLQLLVENWRGTRGDDIETLDYKAEEGVAIIIFKDADSA